MMIMMIIMIIIKIIIITIMIIIMKELLLMVWFIMLAKVFQNFVYLKGPFILYSDINNGRISLQKEEKMQE